MSGSSARTTAPAQSKDVARRVAADVLIAVDRDAAFVNLLLPRLLRERKISGADAGFATELTYGAVRRGGTLDAVVSAAANRDVAALDVPVRAVLRLGSYQLLHTRVATHAAVSTSVDLIREIAGPKASGLVNAVMRRVSQKSWPLWVDQLCDPADSLGRLAFDRGYPRWIAAALLDALGGDERELAAALTDDRPRTHLVARPGQITQDELRESAGLDSTAGRWSPYAVYLGGGDPGAIAAVRDGRAAVQDEGSQLVALALARAELGGRDHRWLDLCAGPGGKAGLLAGLLHDRAWLLAADRAPHRARLVARSVQRMPNVGVIAADGTRPPWRSETFDRVLVDAPCTGLGALRRRPDARWRRDPADVPALQHLQRRLLDTAIQSTRRGGVIAYATCSPHLAETRDVVNGVLSECSDVELIDARASVPDLPNIGDGPFVQLWPHRHGTDAMFIALLRRTESR